MPTAIKYKAFSLVQRGVRAAHAAACDRGLPSRVGLCLHSMERPERTAFREMIAFFKGEGYTFAGPEALLEGEQQVMVSFDDNYRSWHEALPLLDELGVRAVFYVTTGCFRDRANQAEIEAFFDRVNHQGERVPLSTDELRTLHAAGHIVGAHTHTHRKLTMLPVEEAREEIRQSKMVLEDVLGEAVRHFSYPYGMRRYFDAGLRAYSGELGFVTVANAIPGLLHAPQCATDLNRTVWYLDRPFRHNLLNVRIDGRYFEAWTGRSAVG